MIKDAATFLKINYVIISEMIDIDSNSLIDLCLYLEGVFYYFILIFHPHSWNLRNVRKTRKRRANFELSLKVLL